MLCNESCSSVLITHYTHLVILQCSVVALCLMFGAFVRHGWTSQCTKDKHIFITSSLSEDQYKEQILGRADIRLIYTHLQRWKRKRSDYLKDCRCTVILHCTCLDVLLSEHFLHCYQISAHGSRVGNMNPQETVC